MELQAIGGFVAQREFRDDAALVVGVKLKTGAGGTEVYEVQIQIQFQFGIELVIDMIGVAGHVKTISATGSAGFKAQ